MLKVVHLLQQDISNTAIYSQISRNMSSSAFNSITVEGPLYLNLNVSISLFVGHVNNTMIRVITF